MNSTIAVAQFDSTRAENKDSAKTASPINPNSSNVDSIKHTIETGDSVLYIRKIIFEGNQRTRESIMLRELPFEEGDSIAVKDLPEAFEKGKTQLMNTSLFHEANITISYIQGPSIDVKIIIKERWYLFPFPYLKPIDRNLNQWLFEKGASFSRLDYGIKLNYDNVTGNADKLRFYFVTGYTKQLVLSYRRPYIDKSLKWGINLDVMLGKNHELNYNTIDDKQVFLKDDDYVKNFFKGSFEVTYRKAFYTRHTFGFGYNMLRISDTIATLNPNYLSYYKKQVRFPSIYYTLSYQDLDYIPYPTRGYAAELSVSKDGFNRYMNLWQLTAKGLGNWHLGKNAFYSIGAFGALKLPFKQPYLTSQLLGYNDMFLRGYEYYVMDGVAGGLINATLARQLTNFSLHIPKTKWLTPRLVPLKIYGKIYGNAGYAYNPQPGDNRLTNKMLFGGGFGLDIFTMYDFTLKLEFSFNQLGQNGLYLHKKTMF